MGLKSMPDYKVGSPLGNGTIAWETPICENGKYYMLTIVKGGTPARGYSRYIPEDRPDLLDLKSISWCYIGNEDPFGLDYEVDV